MVQASSAGCGGWYAASSYEMDCQVLTRPVLCRCLPALTNVWGLGKFVAHDCWLECVVMSVLPWRARLQKHTRRFRSTKAEVVRIPGADLIV